MSVPDDVREEIRRRLWDVADQVRWLDMSSARKSQLYDEWTKDECVGGLLSRYMDTGQIRVYLKDSLMKGYAAANIADELLHFQLLGVDSGIGVEERHIKPHGRRLMDGRVICWGRASDWKSILMAMHERTFGKPRMVPFAVIFSSSTGRFRQEHEKAMIEDAARRLGIQKVVWAG